MGNEVGGEIFSSPSDFEISKNMPEPHRNELQRAQNISNQLGLPERSPNNSSSQRIANNRTIFGNEDKLRSWQDEANCLGVDPDLFFPERGASTREAKEICRGCVVRLDCLEYALVNGEKFGIWGGMSARERRRLTRQRAQATRRTII